MLRSNTECVEGRDYENFIYMQIDSTKLLQLSMIDPLIINGIVSSTVIKAILMAIKYREWRKSARRRLAHHLYLSHRTDKNFNPGSLAALAVGQLHTTCMSARSKCDSCVVTSWTPSCFGALSMK